MTSELGHIRGLNEITGIFDKVEIGLSLPQEDVNSMSINALKVTGKRRTSFLIAILEESSEQISTH